MGRESLKNPEKNLTLNLAAGGTAARSTTSVLSVASVAGRQRGVAGPSGASAAPVDPLAFSDPCVAWPLVVVGGVTGVTGVVGVVGVDVAGQDLGVSILGDVDGGGGLVADWRGS